VQILFSVEQLAKSPSVSVEEGADTAVWLADEAPQELTGRFFRARQEIPW